MRFLILQSFILVVVLFSVNALADGSIISVQNLDAIKIGSAGGIDLVKIGSSVTIKVDAGEFIHMIRIFQNYNTGTDSCGGLGSKVKTCEKTFTNLQEGQNVFFAVISSYDENGKWSYETTEKIELVAVDDICFSDQSWIEITPVYKMTSSSSADYSVKIKNVQLPKGTTGRDTFRDEFHLAFSTAKGSGTGYFSKNDIVLDPDQSGIVTLTVGKNSGNILKFNVELKGKLIDQLGLYPRKNACGYLITGYKIDKMQADDGGFFIPNPKVMIKSLIQPRKIWIGLTTFTGYELRNITIDGKRDYLSGPGINYDFDLQGDIDTIKLSTNFSFAKTQEGFCGDDMQFKFIPQEIKPDNYVTAKISGLGSDSCKEREVKISPASNQIISTPGCSCKVTKDKDGCGCEFKAPSIEGTFSYKAQMSRNNDNDFEDVVRGKSEVAQGTLTIKNSAKPYCTIDQLSRVSNNAELSDVSKYSKTFEFGAHFYNIPQTVGKLQLSCGDKTTVISTPQSSDSVPSTTGTCEFQGTAPKAISISIGGPGNTDPSCSISTSLLPPQTTEVTLLAGWNIISTAHFTGNQIQNANTNCISPLIIHFEQKGKIFALLGGFEQMQPGDGYMVSVKDQCKVTFNAGVTEPTKLYNGWNIFGVPDDRIYTRQEFEASLDKNHCFFQKSKDSIPDILMYDPIAKIFTVTNELKPGYGYMVFLSGVTVDECHFTKK